MLRKLWERLRRLVVRAGRAEALGAYRDAEASLEHAESRTEEIKTLTNRALEHGYKNHFGERIEAAARKAFT